MVIHVTLLQLQVLHKLMNRKNLHTVLHCHPLFSSVKPSRWSLLMWLQVEESPRRIKEIRKYKRKKKRRKIMLVV
jgi:hypothetical protein